MGGNGKGKETEIPDDMKAQAQEAHERLVELVAEGDDELMEEFFEKGTIPEEDLIPALHNAIREDKIFPVIFGSGLGNIGADRVMDFIVDYTPAPSEHEWVQGEAARPATATPRSAKRPTPSRCRCMSSKPFLIAFAGRISYFKVFSGVLKNDVDGAELHSQIHRKSLRTFQSCRERPRCRSRSCMRATSARWPN